MDRSQRSAKSSTAALTLAALGIVFGDIGTSPLYAVKETFSPQHGIALTEPNILGGLSTIFWALMIVVSLKYVLLIMRADNHGEGGIMALLALAATSVADRPRLRHATGAPREKQPAAQARLRCVPRASSAACAAGSTGSP